MPGSGFQASPESLRKLKDGIEGLVQAQKDAGSGSTGWQNGDGLDNLDLPEMKSGSEEVSAAVKNLGGRAHYFNHALYSAANSIAKSVGATAKSVDENDNMISDSFKKLTNNALLGDPNASKDDLRHKSWGDVATGGRHIVTDLPDQFSQDTIEQHQQHAKKAMSDAWDDTQNTMAKRMGIPNPDEAGPTGGGQDSGGSGADRA